MKTVLSKNKFPQSPKSTKKYLSNKTVPNTMVTDLPKILPKISDIRINLIDTIRHVTYTMDKYTLQTGIVSFFDHEKSLKEIESACTFYQCQY